MTINDKIKDWKLHYDINREEAKMSALSSGWISKYEYLKGEEMLPSDQRRVIEEAEFTYFLLRKLLKNKQKQLKSKEENKLKQLKNMENK